jgi:hypothetical protein
MATKKTETVENPMADLKEALSGEGCSDEALSGEYVVPASPVKQVSAEALANILSGPALMQDGGKGISTGTMIKHYDGKRFDVIKEALQHQEKENSVASHYSHDGASVIMPGSVRETANRLYFRIDQKGNLIQLRDKADKIQAAIFGDENKRVHELANRNGFQLKPLVFVSQQLYHHINNGITHNYEAYAKEHGDEGFDPDTDENGSSPWIQAMYQFLESKTVKDLCREARYRKISVLTVMRCIMSETCDSRGVAKDFGVKKEETK